MRRKRCSVSFLSLFPFLLFIPIFIETRTHTKRTTTRGTRKGKGDSESGTRPMARWPPDTHFTARLNESEKNWPIYDQTSDLWHTYLTNCTSSNYVSSSLNVDRKTCIRNTRLLRDENYIRSFLIDIFTRWRLRADCTNRLCKSFFATRVMFTYV